MEEEPLEFARGQIEYYIWKILSKWLSSISSLLRWGNLGPRGVKFMLWVKAWQAERIWKILESTEKLTTLSPLWASIYSTIKKQQLGGRLIRQIYQAPSKKLSHYTLKGLFCNSFFISSLRAWTTSALFPVAFPAFSTLPDTYRHSIIISSIN